MGISADPEVLVRCKEAILRVDPSAEIYLFGSRARGDAEPESDYDFLILTAGPEDLAREELFLRALFPVEMDTGAVLTFLLYNKKTWNSPLYRAMPLHWNIESEGIRL